MERDIGISHLLRAWYRENKRGLPWRASSDPYIIWVSEVILQQTRVAQGTDYFHRFTERFPDIASLASADEDEVLRYWQGLGYYSRARNLHAAAKTVVERFGGVFPDRYADILSLKGIGEYTAAAILSFAWNRPYPVVDGNVFRVLSRLFAADVPIDTQKGKRLFAELAGRIMDPLHAGQHNQAVMELGALVCVPQNPGCTACPLSGRCAARAEGRTADFPVRRHKARTRNRYFHYFHILYKGTTWISRRGEKDIWEGLYEFPLIETEHPTDFAALRETEAFRRLFGGADILAVTAALPGVRHVLSHQVLYADFYRVEIGNVSPALDGYLRIPQSGIDGYAVPRLIQLYLERMG